MILIDGKKIAAELREELKQEVAELKNNYNKVPGLTVILIGDMAPSQIYVRNKEKSANEVGLKSEVIKYPDTVEEKTILEKIEELNNDENISGILVQLPLPKHIDKQKVIETITPSKDVDGFHPMNVGNLSSGYESSVPCTPLGCYLMIKKIVLTFSFVVYSLFSFSQCVPNPIYQDSMPNIWPSSGFPNGMIGVSYCQSWDMKTPATLIDAALGDTAFVTIDTLGNTIYIGDFIVDSVVTIDVYDIPPGLIVECSSPGCSYAGDQVGCVDISGVPTTIRLSGSIDLMAEITVIA